MFSKSIAIRGSDVFRDEKSLAFDGGDEYVELSGAFNYNVHSISVWVKPKAILGSATIFDYRDANNDGIHIYLGDGDVVYQIDNTDGHYDSVLTLNQWWHIVATNDASTSTIYVNGVAVETADTSGETINVATSAVPRIGARSHTSPSNYFNGNISEVVFYTSALTANQVKTIYNGREPYNHKEGVASGNLQAWYRMGDGVLDDYALIGDETNTTLGSDVLSGSTWNDADANWSESGGVVTASGATGTAYITSVLTQGKTYKIVYTASVTSGSFRFLIGGTNGNLITSSGDYVEYKVCTSSNHINIDGVSSFTGNVSNITVQQVGDNAGLMTNMEATDIEGDTP